MPACHTVLLLLLLLSMMPLMMLHAPVNRMSSLSVSYWQNHHVALLRSVLIASVCLSVCLSVRPNNSTVTSVLPEYLAIASCTCVLAQFPIFRHTKFSNVSVRLDSSYIKNVHFKCPDGIATVLGPVGLSTGRTSKKRSPDFGQGAAIKISLHFWIQMSAVMSHLLMRILYRKRITIEFCFSKKASASMGLPSPRPPSTNHPPVFKRRIGYGALPYFWEACRILDVWTPAKFVQTVCILKDGGNPAEPTGRTSTAGMEQNCAVFQRECSPIWLLWCTCTNKKLFSNCWMMFALILLTQIVLLSVNW